jgi:hypothetical protein
MGPWRLLERVSPEVCLLWCAHVQQRGFETTNKCKGWEELASSLQVRRCCRSCQGRAPYGQRYVGTHHVDHDGCKSLAVIPNSACGTTVGRATEQVMFVPRLPGKSLCEQPSSKAVVANNIVVPPVGKDVLSLSGTQCTPLFPSAGGGVVLNTGAEAPANHFYCCHCVCHGLPMKGGNGGNLWSVDKKTVAILVSHCLKQGRCLKSPQPKKISEVDTSGEYSEPWVLSRAR